MKESSITASRIPFCMAAVAIFTVIFFCPAFALALTDDNGETPRNTKEAELRHSHSTSHFEIFYNTDTEDYYEGITSDEARQAGEFLECAWSFYTEPPTGDYAFKKLKELNGLDTDFDEDVKKIPVWIKGTTSKKCENGGSCTKCGPGCLKVMHSGSSTPQIMLSPMGPVFGCRDNFCGSDNASNCCDETYVGRTSTGYSGVVLHEFGHVLFKGYNPFFNGGALPLLNEGLPSGIMTVPLSTYTDTMGNYMVDIRSVRNADLLRFVPLEEHSLRDPHDNYYLAPVFWYFLASTYTDIAQLDWSYEEMPAGCRQYARTVGLLDDSHIPYMHRVPGRDVVWQLQEALARCHPEGSATPACTDPGDGTPVLEARCATYDDAGHVTDPGCVPAYPLKRYWTRPWDGDNKDYLDRAGEVLMPLLMERIDSVLEEHFHLVPDGIKYQAFRKFLEWNFMHDAVEHVFPDANGTDTFRLKSFGAQYHVLPLSETQQWRIQIEKEDDIPQMASAVFLQSIGTLLSPAYRQWNTRDNQDITVASAVADSAVVMVTAFEGTYDPEGMAPYDDSGGHYHLFKELVTFEPDVFDDGRSSHSPRNDSVNHATELVIDEPDDTGESRLYYPDLNFDNVNDTDFFRIRLPDTSGTCFCENNFERPRRLVITIWSHSDVRISPTFYTSGGTVAVNPADLGWVSWAAGGMQIVIECPELANLSRYDEDMPLVNEDGEFIFSLDTGGLMTGYDLEIRYEEKDCHPLAAKFNIIRIVEGFRPEPEYSIFPNDRASYMDCESNPMCDPAAEYTAIFWQGGNLRLDFTFTTPPSSQEAFSAELLDQEGMPLATAVTFDYQDYFRNLRNGQAGSRAVSTHYDPQAGNSAPSRPGRKAIGRLMAGNLPKGWYLLKINAPFQTWYGFQGSFPDQDQDGLSPVMDNCPSTYNPFQTDTDNDGVGDACDNCPVHYNPGQHDSDSDGFGDECASAVPIPAIRANGKETHLYITDTEPLSVKTSLYAGINVGKDADWWIVALVDRAGMYSLHFDRWPDLTGARWFPGLATAFQDALKDVTPIEIINLPSLPPGTYKVLFGVDTRMNNKPDLDRLFYDIVTIDVVSKDNNPQQSDNTREECEDDLCIGD